MTKILVTGGSGFIAGMPNSPFPPSSPEKPPQAGVLSHDGWLTQTRNNNNSAPRGPAPRGGPHGGDDGALRGQGRAAARRARRQGRQAERHRGGRHCRRGRLRQGGGGHAGARGGDAHGEPVSLQVDRRADGAHRPSPRRHHVHPPRRAPLRPLGAPRRRHLVLRRRPHGDAPRRPGHHLFRGVVEPLHARRRALLPRHRLPRLQDARRARRLGLCRPREARLRPRHRLPPMVYGPLAPGVGVASLDAVNTSNERFVAMLRGKWASEIPATGPVSIWVDVRDVARAHVLAMEKPDAGGRRLYTVGGRFSNRRLVEIVRERFPEYKDRLPGPDVPGGEAPPRTRTSSTTTTRRCVSWASSGRASRTASRALCSLSRSTGCKGKQKKGARVPQAR
ncbi:hypothetical protein ACCO45_005029 [Purpureocillium lilacinum]|uniref:Uncharacterized protein n=1 Tax=Purpureocillium lilacinum TaxID=33203 RepID=A0ACC4DVG9_PURLI